MPKRCLALTSRFFCSSSFSFCHQLPVSFRKQTQSLKYIHFGCLMCDSRHVGACVRWSGHHQEGSLCPGLQGGYSGYLCQRGEPESVRESLGRGYTRTCRGSATSKYEQQVCVKTHQGWHRFWDRFPDFSLYVQNPHVYISMQIGLMSDIISSE